jgi:hypothetical protein
MLATVYFFGPLRVLLGDDGSLLGVQDRVSGIAAAFRYSEAYILAAVRFATEQHLATVGAE